MFSINYVAYLLTKHIMKYQPVSEVKGAKDNPFIELAHQVTGIEDGAQHDSTDEIPWCGSFMATVILLACMLVDPAASVSWVNKRNYALNVVKEVYALFIQLAYPLVKSTVVNAGAITLPVAAAYRAKSWAAWGNEVKLEDAREGDVVVLTRAGGGHVCFLADQKLDVKSKTFMALGGNQSDKLCLAKYEVSNIVAVRRA